MNLNVLKPFEEKNDKIKITICDTNQEIARVFANIFQNEKSVEIIHGNIFYTGADAIVSPANSFGDMGGGLDKAIDDFYKGEAQAQIHEQIFSKYLGEMPVGIAMIIQMNTIFFPYLIVAPTMRIPSNVGKTLNAYLAMRAILVCVQLYNKQNKDKIKNIVLPALCTGIGGMTYQEAAQQMLAAYHNIILENWRFISHPALAPYSTAVQWHWKK